MLKKYLKNLFIAVDQLFNAIFGGDPDETISSRCGKKEIRLCKLICLILNKLDKKHCLKSREEDEGKNSII